MTEEKSLVPSGTQSLVVIWPPRWAIVERKAEYLCVDERVILGQRRDLLVVLHIVDVLPETLVHLGSVDIEAEEIRRWIDIGCLQRARATIDERDLRLGFRIIVYGNTFRARKRGEKDIDFVLLDELLSCAKRRIRASV